MTQATVKTPKKDSLRVGMERRARLYERLRMHPCTVYEACDIFAGDVKDAQRALAKAVKRGKAKVVGKKLREDGGRPLNVYFGKQMKTDWLDHDHGITLVMQALGWPDCTRGADVEKVNGVRPDVVWRGARERLLEYDNDSESRTQILRKVKAYAGTTRAVGFIAPNERRIKELIAWTEAISNIAFFALLGELLADPWGPVWRSRSGQRVAIK